HTEPAETGSHAGAESRQAPPFRLHGQVRDFCLPFSVRSFDLVNSLVARTHGGMCGSVDGACAPVLFVPAPEETGWAALPPRVALPRATTPGGVFLFVSALRVCPAQSAPLWSLLAAHPASPGPVAADFGFEEVVMAVGYRKRTGRGDGPRVSLYEEVTAKIISQLEAGIYPWAQPWSLAAAMTGLPRNALSGRAYSGINVLILWGAIIDGGFASQDWLTFKQALAAGGCVRKGERGQTIFY